jgi:hypothetical protein
MAFLDFILNSFHTTVASSLQSPPPSPPCPFWITVETTNSVVNVFRVKNALNYAFSYFSDSFAVSEIDGGIFRSTAVLSTVSSFMLAYSPVKLGRSHFYLHPSVADAVHAARDRRADTENPEAGPSAAHAVLSACTVARTPSPPPSPDRRTTSPTLSPLMSTVSLSPTLSRISAEAHVGDGGAGSPQCFLDYECPVSLPVEQWRILTEK